MTPNSDFDFWFCFGGYNVQLADIKQFLTDRFRKIDCSQARQDVEPFLHDASVLDVWSADFFCQITEHLTVIEAENHE